MSTNVEETYREQVKRTQQLYARANQLKAEFDAAGKPVDSPEFEKVDAAFREWEVAGEKEAELRMKADNAIRVQAERSASRPAIFGGDTPDIEYSRGNGVATFGRGMTPQMRLSAVAKDAATRLLEKSGLEGSAGGVSIRPPLAAFDGTGGGLNASPTSFSGDIGDIVPRAPRILDLVPRKPVSSGFVEYLRQTTRTNNAAAVARLAAKPVSVNTIEKLVEEVVTYAHISEAVPRQLLRDHDELSGFIEVQMISGVLEAIEDAIVTAILGDAGVVEEPLGANTRLDAILNAITLLRADSVEPDAVVLNPVDAAQVLQAKSAVELTYIVGDPLGPAPTSLWTVPLVIANGMPAGNGLVGNFAIGSRLYDREDATLRFNEGSTEFSTNSLKFLAEQSAAFALLRPYAFIQLTGI
jgi:HK97 family phage major capsid protein